MVKILQYLFIALFLFGLLGFGSVLAFFAGVNIVEEFGVWRELRPAKAWPVQQVQVLESKLVEDKSHWYPVPKRVVCRFAVESGGKRTIVTQPAFSGHYSFMSTGQAAFCARLSSDLPASSLSGKVYRPARVNPADPSQAVLVAGLDDAALGFSMMSALFIGGLGGSMCLLPFVIILKGGLEKPEANSASSTRLTPTTFARTVWLWCAIVMTPGIAAACFWLVPALLRKEGEPSYWIPVALQILLAMFFWWFYLRRRAWHRLAGQSYIELDGRSITRQSPPAGRFYLAPSRDFPGSVSISIQLVRQVTSKHIAIDFKNKFESGRADERSMNICGYPLPPSAPLTHLSTTARGFSTWDIVVRGRTHGRKFRVDFYVRIG